MDIYLRHYSAVNTPVERGEEGNIISVGKGSRKLGTIELTKEMPQELTTFNLPADEIDKLSGQWGVFFVFNAKRYDNICEFYNMRFVGE